MAYQINSSKAADDTAVFFFFFKDLFAQESEQRGNN